MRQQYSTISTYNVKDDMVGLDDLLDLVMFGVGRDDGLHVELRLQNLCLLWVAHERSDFKSVGSGVVEKTIQEGASDIT